MWGRDIDSIAVEVTQPKSVAPYFRTRPTLLACTLLHFYTLLHFHALTFPRCYFRKRAETQTQQSATCNRAQSTHNTARTQCTLVLLITTSTRISNSRWSRHYSKSNRSSTNAPTRAASTLPSPRPPTHAHPTQPQSPLSSMPHVLTSPVHLWIQHPPSRFSNLSPPPNLTFNPSSPSHASFKPTCNPTRTQCHAKSSTSPNSSITPLSVNPPVKPSAVQPLQPSSSTETPRKLSPLCQSLAPVDLKSSNVLLLESTSSSPSTV